MFINGYLCSMEDFYFENHMDFNIQKTNAIYFIFKTNSIHFNYHTGDILILCKNCVEDISVTLEIELLYFLICSLYIFSGTTDFLGLIHFTT
jgi:hypothetical protein